jgi:hypothetical protein
MRHVFELRSRLPLAATCAVLALAGAGCSSMQNLNEAKLLPEMRTFLPSNSTTYLNATQMRKLKPVGAEDLVDGQGLCAGAAPVAATPEGAPAAGADGQLQVTHPVALEMTECEVSRALGAPSTAELGSDGGQRTVVMTYMAGDRPGIYRFSSGRLVSIERGPEAAPPAKPEKKTGRKSAPAKKPQAPNA